MLVNAIGHHRCKKGKIEGKVLLAKMCVLDFNDFNAAILDGIDELIGNKISFQLVSAVNSYSG